MRKTTKYKKIDSPKTLDQIIKTLPAARRAKIDARAKTLITKEARLCRAG